MQIEPASEQRRQHAHEVEPETVEVGEAKQRLVDLLIDEVGVLHPPPLFQTMSSAVFLGPMAPWATSVFIVQ